MSEDGVIVQKGDVVYLKSGSPKLTVVEIHDNGTVDVAWMVYETAVLDRATLPIEGLKIVKHMRTP